MCCNCEYLHEIMRGKLSGKDFANVLREFVSCNIFLYYKCFIELRYFVPEQVLFLVVCFSGKNAVIKVFFWKWYCSYFDQILSVEWLIAPVINISLE